MLSVDLEGRVATGLCFWCIKVADLAGRVGLGAWVWRSRRFLTRSRHLLLRPAGLRRFRTLSRG